MVGKMLKKGQFSDLDLLEIYEWINIDHYEEDSLTRIKTQNTENQNTAEPSTTNKHKKK